VESERNDFENYTVLELKDTQLRMSMTVDFRFKLTGIIKNHSPNLILDCSAARSMDSSFFAAVFAAGNECEQEGGRLLVVTGNPQIRKLLLVGGANQPVTLAESLEEAVGLL
jgi:anti-anti-sigma factor